MTDEQQYKPGVMKYIKEAEKFLAQKGKHLERIKKLKFDTIAVHGLYTVEEALSQSQGAIMEPLYLSTAQAYKDSDEMEAALAYLIPTWCYTRIANPTTYYLEWVLALLEGYQTGNDTSCLVTASGMSAIIAAIDPFLVKQKEGEEKINIRTKPPNNAGSLRGAKPPNDTGSLRGADAPLHKNPFPLPLAKGKGDTGG